MIQTIIDSFSGASIMGFVMASILFMYFFLQPILFIIYICFLISIPIQEDQHKRFKVIKILNKILWWVSLYPFVIFFLTLFILSQDVFDSKEFYKTLLLPTFLTWEMVSLYWVTGFFLFLFYKKARKLIPITWYKLGLWWYGLIFLSTILFIILAGFANIQKN